MENWFVMINVPPYFPDCNPDVVKEVREHIVSKINTFLNTRIEEHILFEHRLTPQGIEARTSSFRGALYGLNSNSRFNAFLRHSNFAKKIPNLYFVGGSVHPGGGIPMCLSSARIVSEDFKPV
jgi:phytoene dehydrogenase-like protein